MDPFRSVTLLELWWSLKLKSLRATGIVIVMHSRPEVHINSSDSVMKLVPSKCDVNLINELSTKGQDIGLSSYY